VIGISELRVSKSPDDLLITYALGSCVGVTMFDATTGVGGLLHALLPGSEMDGERAKLQPATFVDTGVVALLEACERAGANPKRLIVSAAGGAAHWSKGDNDHFQIGRRNVMALKQILWKRGLLLRAHDVGGKGPRNLSLALATGEVTISRYDNVSS
jgi:chemotaxis protein CheD